MTNHNNTTVLIPTRSTKRYISLISSSHSSVNPHDKHRSSQSFLHCHFHLLPPHRLPKRRAPCAIHFGSPTHTHTKTRTMAPSRKATKKAALQKLRTARHEGFARFNSDHVNSDDDAFDDDDGARARSHLDSVKFDEEKPVYEEMDEEAYRNYVSEKLDREDFVVDDGECAVLLALNRAIVGILWSSSFPNNFNRRRIGLPRRRRIRHS